MEISTNERDELVAFCREYLHDNAKQLAVVQEFEKQYTPERAIWWYTRETFLYRLMNGALRKQEIDKLYLFQFFIRDVGTQLEQHKCSSAVHVYRAQYMHREEVELLQKSIDQYISMNSFISTSLLRKQALGFFDINSPSDSVEKVLFETDTNPQLANIKPFANIKKLSSHPEEDEILFMIGSIFRVLEMKRDNAGMWNIRMELCTVNDHKLQELFQHMKDGLGTGKTSLLQFSQVLYKMGKLNDAEKYVQRYLNQLPENDFKRAACYQVLGAIADDKGDYKQALSSYEKALHIWKEMYGEDDPHVAICLNNMGSVYQNENNYSKALDCHDQALRILRHRLPADHSDLGGLYNNIGTTQQCLGDHDQALKQFSLALRVFRKSLPANHPDIAMTMMNMGHSYEEKEDFRQASTYIKGAREILRQSPSSTSVEMIQLNEAIQRLSLKTKE